MMFGQLGNSAGLRDPITIFETHSSKCYCLGLSKNISKTNLAYANQNRYYRIFEGFAYYMISEAREKRKTKIFDIGGSVYAFDSITIDLYLVAFWWPSSGRGKTGLKSIPFMI